MIIKLYNKNRMMSKQKGVDKVAKANEDLRREMKADKIAIWELADVLGVHEMTAYRYMRHELTEDQRKTIRDAIRTIKAGRVV